MSATSMRWSETRNSPDPAVRVHAVCVSFSPRPFRFQSPMWTRSRVSNHGVAFQPTLDRHSPRHRLNLQKPFRESLTGAAPRDRRFSRRLRGRRFSRRSRARRCRRSRPVRARRLIAASRACRAPRRRPPRAGPWSRRSRRQACVVG